MYAALIYLGLCGLIAFYLAFLESDDWKEGMLSGTLSVLGFLVGIPLLLLFFWFISKLLFGFPATGL
ncbi:hypothetical protein GGQ19_001761 [Salinibacter ruber]|nr:hypothetical protein [Salinibacter ruber]